MFWGLGLWSGDMISYDIISYDIISYDIMRYQCRVDGVDQIEVRFELGIIISIYHASGYHMSHVS